MDWPHSVSVIAGLGLPLSHSDHNSCLQYQHRPQLVNDTTTTRTKIEAMITLGVPYEKDFPAQANQHLAEQSAKIAAELKKGGIEALADREIIAMIAYLQRVGTDIKAAGKTASAK